MNTTNHSPHPYALRPIKPPPWRYRFRPLGLLYHLLIISVLLLLSNKLNPSTSTSFNLRPKHSSLNTHSQNPTKPTASDRPWPDSLHKNYTQSSTTPINNSPHSTTPLHHPPLPLPTTHPPLIGAHGRTHHTHLDTHPRKFRTNSPMTNYIPKRPPKRPPKFSIAEEKHTNSQQTFTVHFSPHFPKTDTIATAFPNNSFPNLEFSTKQHLELIIRNDLPHTYNDLSHTYKNALSHLPTSPKTHKKSLG